MPVEDVRALATGLTFTGMDAVENGLADELGTLETAVAKACELAGIADADTVYLQSSTSDLSRLLDIMGTEDSLDVSGTLKELENRVGLNSRERVEWPARAVVTAGMPYGNKPLHFGHIGGVFVPADAFARFLRDRIGAENVRFVSGTDCFGSPINEGYRKLKEPASSRLHRRLRARQPRAPEGDP